MVLEGRLSPAGGYGRGMEWVQLGNSEVTAYGSRGVGMSTVARLEKVDGEG